MIQCIAATGGSSIKGRQIRYALRSNLSCVAKATQLTNILFSSKSLHKS